ncbi:MAG: CdaR family protein, partial [Sandaracinaceae bacterium]
HVNYVDSVSAVVVISVEVEVGSRELADVDVAVVGGAGVTVRPETVTVTLSGPRARIDELHPRRVIPFVDVSTLDPARGAQPVPVSFRPVPDGMSVSAEPSEVLVVPPR